MNTHEKKLKNIEYTRIHTRLTNELCFMHNSGPEVFVRLASR